MSDADAMHPLERAGHLEAEPAPSTHALKHRSYELTGDPKVGDGAPGSYVKMACSRSNLRAVGWKESDFRKPIITVGVPYTNIMPCNNKFLQLAERVCEAIEKEGGKPMMAW